MEALLRSMDIDGELIDTASRQGSPLASIVLNSPPAMTGLAGWAGLIIDGYFRVIMDSSKAGLHGDEAIGDCQARSRRSSLPSMRCLGCRAGVKARAASFIIV